MSCSQEQSEKQITTSDHLQHLLKDISPRERYLSQMHVEEYIDSIYMEIVNGDMEIAKQPKNYGGKQANKKNGFEQILRKRVIQQAQRDKIHYQDKLNYIDRSINHLYRQEKPNSTLHRHSFSVNSPREKQEWRKQIQERGKILGRKRHQVEESKKKKQQQLQQIQERMKKEQQQIKKKQIIQHMKVIQERTKKRQEDVKEASARYQEVKKDKNLFQKMTESYQQKQSSVLQEHKKKLAEIRSLHRPIDSNELLDHQQRFLEQKRQKQQMREREKRMNQSRSNSYQQFYKSAFYKRAIEDSRVQMENQQVVKRQKIKQFSQHVKECFIPQIDEKKRAELEDLIENQKRKLQLKQEKQRQLLEKPRNKGNQYLELVKKLPKKKKENQNMSVDNVASKTDRRQYQNYLTHVDNVKSNVKPWNKILTSSEDKQSKALMLQFQSEKRQGQLKRKEQQIRLLKQGNTQEIDQEYFEMIRAKLDLLQTSK